MNKGKTYACADIHGVYIPFRKMIDFLKPEDTLYFLGDSCDRGEDGIRIFQELTSDPRVKMIKGNHEEMMARAILPMFNEEAYITDFSNIDLWYNNGGIKTAKAFDVMTEEEVFNIKKKIDSMPTELRYISPAGHIVILEHAGYTPLTVARRSHDPLWDREHFHDKWNDGWEYQPGSEANRTYLVHGHTPVQFLKYHYGYDGQQPLTKEELRQKREWNDYYRDVFNWKPEIIRYCSGHKFDIDMCTVVSNRVALLDLDTFEEIYFDTEG